MPGTKNNTRNRQCKEVKIIVCMSLLCLPLHTIRWIPYSSSLPDNFQIFSPETVSQQKSAI